MSDGGSFTVKINGALIAQHSSGYVPQNSPERAHMHGTYTPSANGLYTLEIYNYRNAARTQLYNYIDDVTLVPRDADFLVETPNISVAAAGSAGMTVMPGPAHAGKYYLVLAAAGCHPGFDIDGHHVHLNYDAILSIALANMNSAMFQNSYGVLNASGEASFTFKTPGAFPNQLGKHYDFAYVLMPTGARPIDYCSVPVIVNFIP